MSDMGGVFGFFLGLSLLKIFTAIWDYLMKTALVKWIRAWPICKKIGFKSIQDIFKLYRRWSLFWSLNGRLSSLFIEVEKATEKYYFEWHSKEWRTVQEIAQYTIATFNTTTSRSRPTSIIYHDLWRHIQKAEINNTINLIPVHKWISK